MKIVKIATYENGLTQDEALAKAKEMNLRLLTNKEMDELLIYRKQESDEYKECFPCWTGTYVDYNGQECTVTENGKSEKIQLPNPIGWYIQDDKYGIPNQAASDESEKRARFLKRTEKNKGLIWREWLYDDYHERNQKRYVYVSCWPWSRFGVLGTPLENIH